MKSAAFVVGVALLAAPVHGGVKEDQHAAMLDLARQMSALKSAGASASAGYAALRSQYEAISAAMGGDDPAAAGSGAPRAPLAAPTPPAGCAAIVTNVANNTPTVIVDVDVITSTVVVAGAGAYLFDLDLTTFITHTFAADLDITLESPAGTIATISTDNGAGNDDVFNGTLWDDQANTPATDFVYANGVPATALTIEEAMGLFLGEDPNGTWTLSVVDDLAGDVGTLSSWSLAVTSFSAAPTWFPTAALNNTPTAILDVATVTSTVATPATGYLAYAEVTMDLTHTFAADLDITLESPAGTVVTLTTDNGGGNDNVFVGMTWRDDADEAATDHVYVNNVPTGPLNLEGATSAFVGEDPFGTWTLSVTDDLGGDVGTLNSWTLFVQTATCGCTLSLVCPGDVTVDAAPGESDAVVSYAAPTVGGTCTSVSTVCAPPSDGSFPLGTTQVSCTATDANTGTQEVCTFNVTVNGVSILEVPTASSLGLAALALLLAGAAFLALRRS